MAKRLGWIALFVLGALFLGSALFRPESSLAETTQPPQRTLDVVGQGKMTVKYDTATISLGFSTLRDTPTGAYGDMSDAMNKVVAALKQQGIKEEDMKTGTFNLAAQYDWSKQVRQLTGYQATNNLTVTTQSLDKVAVIIEAAVAAGANQVNGVNFSIKNTDALVNQALDLAVDDAKAKAERVAKRLGAQVAGVYKISIQDGGRSPILYEEKAMRGAATAMDAAAPVLSGTGEYTATVSVTFELR